MFDDISNAPYVFFPLFFASLGVMSLIEGTTGACPGFKFAPKHAAEHPLNMPFDAAKSFDMKKCHYSSFQVFRMMFGVTSSTLLLIAGWIGSHGLLTDYPDLEKFAWNPMFFIGATFLFLHTQMTWERLHNGNQLCDIKAFIPCAFCRFVIGGYFLQWLLKVQEIEDDAMNTIQAAIMVWCVKIALTIFVLTDVIRVVVITTKGQEAFFSPKQSKKVKV